MIKCPYCEKEIDETEEYFDWDDEYFGNNLLSTFSFCCNECGGNFFVRKTYSLNPINTEIIKES